MPKIIQNNNYHKEEASLIEKNIKISTKVLFSHINTLNSNDHRYWPRYDESIFCSDTNRQGDNIKKI